MGTGVVNKVLVMHARRARAHARQARQTAVQMLHNRLCRGTAVLQHIFDLVDAAARAIQLIAKQDIRWAGSGAETAMDASAQNLFRFGDVSVSQLSKRKIRLHGRAVPLAH